MPTETSFTEKRREDFNKLWNERIAPWLVASNVPKEYWPGVQHACWIAWQERIEQNG